MHYTESQLQMQNYAYNAAWEEYETRMLPFDLYVNGSFVATRMITRAAADKENEKHARDWAPTVLIEKKGEVVC